MLQNKQVKKQLKKQCNYDGVIRCTEQAMQ